MKKTFLIPLVFVASLGLSNAQNATTTSKPAATPAKPAAAAVKPAAQAGPGKTAEEKAKFSASGLDKAVSLKADQSEKVNKVYFDFYTKRDALTAKKASMESKDYWKQSSELVKKKDADIKALLTPEQLKVLEAKKGGRSDAAETPGQAK
jgi:hypothetical protein